MAPSNVPEEHPEFQAEEPAGLLAEPPAPPAMRREALRRLVLDCGEGLLGPGANRLVPGEGNPAAAVVLVGEAPGEEEDRQGRPFVGRSGKLLEQVLATAGFDRRELWITNAAKARPVAFENGRARNRQPLASELKAWRPCLEAELRLIRPRLLVGLGAIAGKALVSPDFKITRQRGEWYPDAVLGAEMLVTWHPSYILRQKGEDYRARLNEAIADFRRVAERLRELEDGG